MNGLAQFLPEYSSGSEVFYPAVVHDKFEYQTACELEPSARIEENIKEAYERGRSDAELEINLANDAKIEQIYVDFAAHTQVEKHRWLEAEASKVSAEFLQKLEDIKFDLSDLLYKAIIPFMKKKIVAGALHETKQLLLSALNERENVRIEISGPEVWVNAFKASMEAHEVEFVYSEKPETEVHLSCDNFSIATHINTWLKSIENTEFVSNV